MCRFFRISFAAAAAATVVAVAAAAAAATLLMMMMMMTQEIPKISSKFLRPVKARSLGGDDKVPSMFARSLTIGKVEDDGHAALWQLCSSRVHANRM